MPPSMETPCDACAAPCCRSYHIVITLYDAYRIANTLKIPVGDFAELRWVDEPREDYRIVVNGQDGADVRLHRLSLKKVPDSDPKYEKRCVFLVTVGERGRCGVYGVRPDACRVYPTVYTAGLVSLGSTSGKYCPPGAWQAAGFDDARFRLAHLHRHRQKLLHHLLVEAWNERILHDQESVEHDLFFAFVQNVYRELVARRPALFDEDSGEVGVESDLRTLTDLTLRAIGFRSDDTVASARQRAARP